jgi:signal transduction histidine kinase/ligand-binding sensor domain-containing protein
MFAWVRWYKPTVAGVLALLCCGPLWSQESVLTLAQFNRQAFHVSDGAPALVQALAQTPDGTLWVGSGMGLFRFDGMHFWRYPSLSDEPLPATNVTALSAAPDGGLWIGFKFGGICLLREGQVIRYGVRDGMPEGSVRRFALDRDGTLWAAATGGIGRVRGGRMEKVSSELFGTADNVTTDIVIDRAGNIWVATNKAVVARRASEAKFHVVQVAAAPEGGINTTGGQLAESPDGHVWFIETGTVSRLDLSTDPARNRTFQLPQALGGRVLFFDREGDAWFPTYRGVGRWQALQLLADLRSDTTTAHVETFLPDNDLIYLPRVFYQDREQSVWIANPFGLVQFSRSSVERSLEPCSGMGYALAAGDAGILWAACGSNEASKLRLLELRDGVIKSERPAPNFTAGYRDPTGTLWFAGPTALAHLEGDSIISRPTPEQVRGLDVQALARDAQGALWVSVVQRAVYRVSEDRWVAYGGLEALPRGPAITETGDGRGGIWFGYPDNRIAHLREKSVQVYGPADGIEVGNITAIHVTGEQVWVGGDFGLARFSNGRFNSVLTEPSCTMTGVSGIVHAENADLWANASSGIAHFSRQEVERAIREPAYRVRCEVYDHQDGVPGPAVQLRPTPSAVATSDGRLWFEMWGGTVSIDTRHLVRGTVAPPVTIWAVNSAGQRYPNRGTTLYLPAHTTNVQIEYSAAILTAPERVRFRYKLEGSDSDWQDAGARREAVYTNLGPGHYRLWVNASNSDGIWSISGDPLDFVIAPAFYQTRWFYALCALLAFAVLASVYRLRIEQVREQTSRLAAALLGERERIARELHDTLLQSMQGLIWKFQAAAKRIPREEPARELMEQSLQRADKLLGEGRDRVKDLRAAGGGEYELSQALAAEGEQLSAAQPAEFRLSIESVPRDLQPIVREEAFMIAREALGNAFRHADARHIEVDLSYSESELRVRVRDDGRGVSAEVLTSGRPNRFGLVGMRERALKLGAQLDIWSRPGAGTEVELRIPANIAFRSAARVLRWAWWRRSARKMRAITSTIG